MTRLTTVVVSYNGADDIGHCLESLLAGGLDPEQVLVFDNASTDNTLDVVRSRFPSVRIVASDLNLGYGEACNRAAKLCQSEYLAVINQDAIAQPGWTDALLAALQADPRAALATAKVLLQSDPGLVNAAGNSPHFTGITTCRGFREPSTNFARVEEVPAISGCAFAIRRSTLLELGGFDGDYFLYFEDTDLSLRAQLAGYTCLLVPDAVVLHDFEATFSAAKLRLLERNRLTTWLKLFRWRTLLLLAPAMLLTELMSTGFALLGGRSALAARLQAVREVFHGAPAIPPARRRVQATRRISDRELLSRLAASLDIGEMDHGLGAVVMAVANPMYRSCYRFALAAMRW